MMVRRILVGVCLGTMAALSAVLFSGADAHAQAMPANASAAQTRVSNLCNAGNPVAHAAYVTNVSLDESTGVVSYRINVMYQRCSRAPNTSFYAVTGYPRSGTSGTLTVCPNVGTYGANPTYDCVKYVGNPANSYHVNRTNGNFYGLGVGRNSTQPSTTLRTTSINLTGTVSNWSTRTQTSGSVTLGASRAVCAYWRDSGGIERHGQLCQDIFVTVSWERPWTINGQSYIKNTGGDISAAARAKTAEQQGTITAAPGDRLNWYHDLRNNGPNTMHRDVSYRVDKTGFSNGWNATTAPTGDAGSGEVSNSLFLTLYASSSPSAAHSLYDVTQDDVGNTLCQRISWDPGAEPEPSPSRSASAYACADVPYDYELTPTVTLGRSQGSAGESVTVHPTVANSGPTKSRPSQWQLTYFTLPSGSTPASSGATSASPPAAHIISQGGSGSRSVASGTNREFFPPSTTLDTETEELADLPVGTRACYLLSVQAVSHASSNWAHSRPQCVVISKKPQVQIHGGSLQVGRTFDGTYNSTAEVRTSTTIKPSGTFGSWAEYGVFAPGAVTGMGSGSGLNLPGGASSSAQRNWSPYTFTRSSDDSYGAYASTSATLPDITTSFPNSSAITATSFNLSTVAKGRNIRPDPTSSFPGNNITLTANAPTPERSATLMSGEWLVVNAIGYNITVASDLTYADGPYTEARQIPQLIILADNITIAAGVERVDAWLIAKNDPARATAYGAIATCDYHIAPNAVTSTAVWLSARNGSGTNYTESSNARLTSHDCNRPLRINGPVMANHLYLRRTAGAGSGADAGTPAEVINLRADAYLWANQHMNTSRIYRTTNVKELPPRY